MKVLRVHVLGLQVPCPQHLRGKCVSAEPKGLCSAVLLITVKNWTLVCETRQLGDSMHVHYLTSRDLKKCYDLCGKWVWGPIPKCCVAHSPNSVKLISMCIHHRKTACLTVLVSEWGCLMGCVNTFFFVWIF